LLRPIHRFQNDCVWASASAGEVSAGIFPSDEQYVSVNVIVSPLPTVNSLTVVEPSPRSGAFVCSTTMSEPATARSSLFEVTHGTVRP